MRHQRHIAHFGRKSGPRKALIRGLVISLVEHERIRTTVTKAKELRRHVERAVTTGKTGSLHSRRLLLARYPNKDTVEKLMTELGPRFKERNGGYTRIIKVGSRPGDGADMAFIEFVDYAGVGSASAKSGGESSAEAGASAGKKVTKKKAATKKKVAKKATTKSAATGEKATKKKTAKKTAAKKVSK